MVVRPKHTPLFCYIVWATGTLLVGEVGSSRPTMQGSREGVRCFIHDMQGGWLLKVCCIVFIFCM